MVSRTIFKDCGVKFAELIAGRMQHVRIETVPPIDLLNVYQYAWNIAKKELQNQLASPEQVLLQQRQDVWKGLQSWIASIPKRNSLVIAGDMNASLTSAHPHVGPGTGSMHWHKKDNHSLQAILQTSGLNAVNTWRKAGKQAATFLTHKGEASQIDYIILRNPCNLSRVQAHTIPLAPIVHPTGFRHIPVQCYIPWPSVPKHAPKHVATAATVRRTCERQPAVLESFCREVAALQCSAEELDQKLSEAWTACQRQAPILPVVTSNQPEVNLKTYWDAKRHLQMLAASSSKECILAGQINAALLHNNRVTCTGQFVRTILKRWRALAVFQVQNKLLRKRTRDRKQAKVERQIEEAIAADSKGLTYLYKCMNTLRPKQPKRTIHIKGKDGSVQSDQAEITSICEYFQQVFSSSTPKVQQECRLQGHLFISLEEIRDALHSLSAKKALPTGHAPTRLWKAGGDTIVRILHEDWSSRFSPGQLCLPSSWNESSTVLIPKPGKPPTSPPNLRPISLLLAIPKMLARIAANRLRPYLEEAAFQMPQFAYLSQRQTLDSIDRAVAHCVRIRKRIAENRINPFRSKARIPFTGGMQLSLDMTKAFDRMPRLLLLQSLERICTPADLIALIMYVHDNACMQFQRNQQSRVISAGSGIRQGCGLAPLLWVAYTLLIFSKMFSYLSPQQLTGFADDLHMQWSFDTPRHFKNACAQVSLILKDLREAGMQVSPEKTVILLALSGQSYSQDVKPFIRKTKSGRCLKVHDGQGEVLLPIKTTHTYLGVKIGFQSFERSTLQHRLQLSWQAFHRLHTFLCTKKLAVQQRLRLWRACVLSIAQYGLTALGLDDVGATKYRAHVFRQLRIITGNPGHLTHETNSSLAARYAVKDPVHDLCMKAVQRIKQAQCTLFHLQGTLVQQRWTQLLSDLATHSQNVQHEKGTLTEVTKVIRIQCSCDVCGQQFGSFHALRTHIGKAHPENSSALTKASYPERSARNDERIKHSVKGKPQCKHCNKQFSGWAACMAHHNQRACPVFHAPPVEPAPSSESSPAHGTLASGTVVSEEESVPIFHQPDIIAQAKQGEIGPLADSIRRQRKLSFCPECGVQCKTPMYVTRHATKMHAAIKAVNALIVDWARNCQVPANPCTWCGDTYQTQAKAHRNACPVLWSCGHLLHRRATLKLPGQTTLTNDDSGQRGRADARHSRAGGLCRIHTSNSGDSKLGSIHCDSSGGAGQRLPHAGGGRPEEEGRSGGPSGRASSEEQVAKRARQGHRTGPRVQSRSAAQESKYLVERQQKPGLLAFFRGPEKSGSSHGASSDTSRGLLIDSSTGYTTHAVPEESRSSQASLRRLEHSSGALFGWQALAGAERAKPQPSQPAAEGSPSGLSMGCPTNKGEAAAKGPSIEGDGRTERSDGEWSLPIPTMGPREEGVCASDPRTPLLQGRGRGFDNPQAAVGPPARDSSLSCNAKANSGDDQRSGALHACEIQNRSQESQQCFHLLGKPSRNACTHLIAATLRPAKLGRSPLANTVDRLLQEI